ncbi:MAG: hypothetical protein PHW76_09530, partial [Alphaproteobacteria bacterium]|nr:hypothetical protein [Alphaproteobacteria bacterium]
MASMIDYAPYPEEVFAPREAPIANDLADYIAELVERAPGKIIFRTGAGRVERDLLLHWPIIRGGEDEAQRLCKKISEAVFPLLGSLYAQGVELSVLISNDGLEPPRHVEAMATWVVFDAAERLERTMFLSPRRDVPPSNALRAARGVAVHSTPLNYRYHTLKDDRSRKQHTHVGIYELPERLIAEMYEEPPYVPLSAEQKKILDVVKAKVYELRQTVPRWEEKVEKVPSQPIPTVTALSALPPPVRALEHQVMGYAMDKELSPDFRMGLRRVAQSLRQPFPQASIEEAARLETAPGPVPVAAPRFYLSPQTEEARSLAPATTPIIVSGGAAPSLARAGVIGPPYYATMRYLPPAYQPVASYAPPQNLATVRYLPVPEYQGSANLATLKYAPATVFPTVHYAEPLSLLPTGMAPSPRYEGPVNLATLKYAPAAIFPIASYTGPANLEALRYIPAASLPTAEYASLAHLATAIYPPASIGPIVRYQEPSLLPVTRYAGPSNLMTPQYLPAGGPPTVQYAGPPVFASLEYLPSAA